MRIDPKKNSKLIKYLAIVPTLFLLSSCSLQRHEATPDLGNKAGTSATTDKLEQTGSIQVGQASVYADKFQGKKTASGDAFSQDELTAASKEHAFESKLKVTNKKTGQSTIVTVTDRGPYTKGRIIDLSKAAAEQIGMPTDGVTEVTVEKLQ